MTMLSVIVPAFNEERYLPDTLGHIRSALASANCPSELIVVDNESTDATVEIALTHDARVITETEHNIAKVRNTGAANAIGDVLIFIDADTHVPQVLFRSIAEAMEDRKCFGGAVTVQYEPFRRKWLKYYVVGWKFWDHFFNMKQGAAQFCRRSVFEEIKGYDETIFVGEDIQFYWRLARHARRNGRRLHYITDLKVITSSRRFDNMSLAKILLYTQPLYFYLNWRKRHRWDDWYQKTVR
jgi:glycosyltransferase involved in cell wall biosynthesis